MGNWNCLLSRLFMYVNECRILLSPLFIRGHRIKAITLALQARNLVSITSGSTILGRSLSGIQQGTVNPKRVGSNPIFPA